MSLGIELGRPPPRNRDPSGRKSAEPDRVPRRSGLYFDVRFDGELMWEIAAHVCISNTDDGRSTMSCELYFRPAGSRATREIDAILSGKDGWRSHTEWRKRIRDSVQSHLEHDRLEALAERKNVHLLECSICRQVSDLNARGWRITHDGFRGLTTTCPSCGPVKSRRRAPRRDEVH